MEEILDYLKEEKERSLVENERIRRAKAKADLESVAFMQEVSWRQKSITTWLKEGDHYI